MYFSFDFAMCSSSKPEIYDFQNFSQTVLMNCDEIYCTTGASRSFEITYLCLGICYE